MAVYKVEGCRWNCYPGTTVLENKFGITDQAQLDAVEKQITLLRCAQAERDSVFENVDFAYYLGLHKRIFGDLYDWAGKLRDVNLSKKGVAFCDYGELGRLGEIKFLRLAEADYLRGLAREDFVGELADFYHGMNMLHPFREGNGRTLRLFAALLVRNAGYDVDFSECDPDVLIIAAIKAAQGDISLLEAALGELVKSR